MTKAWQVSLQSGYGQQEFVVLSDSIAEAGRLAEDALEETAGYWKGDIHITSIRPVGLTVASWTQTFLGPRAVAGDVGV